MEGKSSDIKQEQIEKLKQLFPESVSEGKIDWEKLRLTLGEDVTIDNERYVLNWAGKSDAFRAIQTPTTTTLKPRPDQSVDFEKTRNIFIEGENLEVLKVLQKSYYGKVKMISIDPPYNTGNDSFIYPDKFSESKDEYLRRIGDKDEAGYLTKEGFFRKNSKENGQYHSNWLSMMYPRLFLARNLLRDDGVIFVSIDDNEVHNLRLMMNEIFGEENFVASIVWQHSVQPKGYLEKFSVHHNYILCYQKTNAFFLNALERTEENNQNYANPDGDPNGLWRSGDVRNALYRPNLIYDIATPSGKKISPPKNGWRWSKETLSDKIRSGEIVFSRDETRIIRKIYLSRVEGRAPETIWFGKEVGTTREAATELKQLFHGQVPFETPKPVRLIQKMLQIGTEADGTDIVLDFFGGSGTTAQAVMELNKEDGGNRKFILVQLPEKTDEESEAYKAGYKTIADICRERIKRVGEKVKSEKSKAEGLFKGKELDSGFKAFTLEPSNFKVWRTDTIENGEDLVKQMDAFADPVHASSETTAMAWEILVKSGYELTTKVERITLPSNAYGGDKKQPDVSFPNALIGNPSRGVSGFPLEARGNDIMGISSANENGGVPVYLIAGGEVVLALEKISQAAIDQIVKMSAKGGYASGVKPKNFICLDRLFAGNDQLKTNTALQMRDAGVEFKTV